ncbi:MAG: hypothetical protein WBP72_07950 [Rhodocyclaceae bacterium]
MAAKLILGGLALAFLLAAIVRMVKERGSFSSAARTWLLVAAIFAGVAGYLWLTGP